MALLYDEMGNVIGDDGVAATAGQAASTSAGGVVDTSTLGPADVGYFQKKVNEFQDVLYSVDATATSLMGMLDEIPDLTEAEIADIQDKLSQYDSRKSAFKFAAEAFNAVAGMVNSVGGSMSKVDIPMSLGFAPLAIPIAWAAAIAGAAILVSWGVGWVSASHQTASSIAMRIVDPAKRDVALAKVAQIAAAEQASGGMLGSLANIAKYVAIGAALWLAYKVYMESQHKKAAA